MKTILNVALMVLTLFAFEAQAKKVTYLKGEFQTITPGDDVSGHAYLKKGKDGNYYVILGDDFETKNAPDLRVVLHKDVVPRSYKKSNSIFLGHLKETKGKQIYKVPSGSSLKGIKAVIIYCLKYNVTFGSAKLKMIKK